VFNRVYLNEDLQVNCWKCLAELPWVFFLSSVNITLKAENAHKGKPSQGSS